VCELCVCHGGLAVAFIFGCLVCCGSTWTHDDYHLWPNLTLTTFGGSTSIVLVSVLAGNKEKMKREEKKASGCFNNLRFCSSFN
jgi:hypothetical protein